MEGDCLKQGLLYAYGGSPHLLELWKIMRNLHGYITIPDSPLPQLEQ